MQQVLQITTIPGQYHLNINPAKLEYEQEHIPTADVHSTKAKLHIETKEQTMKISTYEARKSLGFSKIGDRIRDAAQKGEDDIVRFIKEANQLGRSLSRIDQGVTIGSLMKQKLTQQSSLMTVFIPNSGANISWQAGDIKVKNTPGTLNYDWNIKDYQLHYTRGDVSLEVVQKPAVEIKYVGSPLYVPRSSDPNYAENQ